MFICLSSWIFVHVVVSIRVDIDSDSTETWRVVDDHVKGVSTKHEWSNRTARFSNSTSGKSSKASKRRKAVNASSALNASLGKYSKHSKPREPLRSKKAVKEAAAKALKRIERAEAGTKKVDKEAAVQSAVKALKRIERAELRTTNDAMLPLGRKKFRGHHVMNLFWMLPLCIAISGVCAFTTMHVMGKDQESAHAMRRKSRVKIQQTTKDWMMDGFGLDTKGSDKLSIGERIRLAADFNTLVDVMPGTCAVAIRSASRQRPLPAVSHEELLAFVTAETNLLSFVPAGVRVGLVLPNGPGMAIMLLACCAKHACVPLGFETEASVLKNIYTTLRCNAVVCVENSVAANVATEIRLTRIFFPADWIPGKPMPALTSPDVNAQHFPDADDPRKAIALIILTSGSTGQRKAVLHTLEGVIVGAMCIVRSWALTSDDRGLNMMPLFHIGGITRSVFATILSGGSVCCANSFDPELFWEIIEPCSITWYYAGPTIHEVILRERERIVLSNSANKPTVDVKLRFIGNAAGHLPDKLAHDLRAAFQCNVLPSYGSTEAMPMTSPPVDYQLDRPGSSGQLCGPELRIVDDNGVEQAPDKIGHIVVRGCPVMSAYEGVLDTDAYIGDWLRTGDMGYLSIDGWLYITGRSKEVINRGGEILSPAEIEESVSKHQCLKECAVFSTPHETLQETVGVVLVMAEVDGKETPRVDIQSLHRFLSDKLLASKWPQVIIYMKELPRGATKKVLRSKIAERCHIPQLKDKTPLLQRHFEATCPAPGAPLTEDIPCQLVEIDVALVERWCEGFESCRRAKVRMAKARGQEVLTAHVEFDDAGFTHERAEALLEHLQTEHMPHDYELPTVVVPLEDVLDPLPQVQHWRGERFVAATGDWEPCVAKIFQQNLEPGEDASNVLWLSVDRDFFEAGGTSLIAGRVMAQLRLELSLQMSVQSIYQYRTVQAMAKFCAELYESKRAVSESSQGGQEVLGAPTSTEISEVFDDDVVSDAGFLVVFIQLLPILICKPLREVAALALFMAAAVFGTQLISDSGKAPPDTSFVAISIIFVGALAVRNIVVQFVNPLVTIFLKWLIVGTYKPGAYKIYSGPYLRWWIYDILYEEILGWGILKHDRCLFLRLMGADVHPTAKISAKAQIREFDLISVGPDAVIETSAIVRGFSLSCGKMRLQPIKIGTEAEVCFGSVVSPGHSVPDAHHVGVFSSSYSVEKGQPARHYDRSSFEMPPWYLVCFLGGPILLIKRIVEFIPILCLWVAMRGGVPKHLTVRSIVIWLASPERLMFWIWAPAVVVVITPILTLIWAIFVKRAIIGKFKAGSQKGAWAAFQHWMTSGVIDSGSGRTLISEVNGLFGTHFGVTSFIYRQMGMKVGERIYWPGTGVDVIEFDLMEVRDDTIFGSRSHFFCRDQNEAQSIVIEEGCMIADRCLLLPGCTVSKNTMLGSGTLAPAGIMIPPDTMWVGHQNGAPVQLFGQSTGQRTSSALRPFGKAFHRKEAPYYVWPEWIHALYCLLWTPLVAMADKAPTYMMLLLLTRTWDWIDCSNFCRICIAVVSLGIMKMIMMCFGLSSVVGLCWLIVGVRSVGRYPWDESSYCQRWLLSRCIRKLEANYFPFIRGTPLICAYFREHGAKIGRGVCLYPTGAHPYMTEPELVTIGDGACIDEASLVAHSNAFGDFELRKLEVGRFATMRRRTRLLAGASLGDHTELYEHTLVLPGDHVPEMQAWQGWPPVKTLRIKQVGVGG